MLRNWRTDMEWRSSGIAAGARGSRAPPHSCGFFTVFSPGATIIAIIVQYSRRSRFAKRKEYFVKNMICSQVQSLFMSYTAAPFVNF